MERKTYLRTLYFLFLGMMACVAVISAIEVVSLAQKGAPIAAWARPLSMLCAAFGFVLGPLGPLPSKWRPEAVKVDWHSPLEWAWLLLTIAGVVGMGWSILR